MIARTSLAIASLFAVASMSPRQAGGQEFITKIFERATDISPFFQAGWLTADENLDTRGSALLGYGIEVLFAIKDDKKSPFAVELALGYNYLTGFRSANPALDLRGSMRTLPELSVYATYEKLGRFEPYVGVHTGLLDLWHTQAYDEDGQQYSVASESFQAGVTGGVVMNGIWIEGSYRIRNFPSLEWTLPEDATVLPAEFPRSLDLTGWSVRIGYQFSIGKGTGDSD